MKRVPKVLGKTLLGFAILGIVVFIALYLATAGTYEVAQTAAQDASIPSVTLDGVTFHAETFGDSVSPAVIVLHGGPGGDFRYLLNLEALSDEYYVVFCDQRGSGLSPRVDPSELTLDSSIEDLNRIVEYYGNGEPVNLVGHSWGGTLVTAYAGRYPAKVAHLVVAEPGSLSNEAHADFQCSARSIDFSFGLKAVRLWFESLHVSGPDAYARDDYFLGHISEVWEFAPTNGFNCPGTPVPEDHFWRAGAVVIPDAGHDMFWDNPQDSIAAVRDFLGR